MRPPEVRYARDGELSVAYQSWGSGTVDLVLVWGTFSHCELFWEDPDMARFLEQLGTFARVAQFDKRGTGMSDAVPGIPTLEERMDDARIVMDAVGMERAALVGESEGAPMSCLFAATLPQRVSHLVLYGPLVSLSDRDGLEGLVAPEDLETFIDAAVELWGTGAASARAIPSRSGDEAVKRLFARLERHALTPKAFRQLAAANAAIDIAPVLPTVTIPTLVLHRVDDRLIPADHGRFYARSIPGAELVELPGQDHYVAAGNQDAVIDQIRRFLGGETAIGTHIERVLSTVLFTDIVESTRRAADVGDQRWRALLDHHDRLVATEVARWRGRVVKSTGDGALATFDGPARAVRCAHAIASAVRALGLEVRAGVHTGEVELRGDDIGGIAVHLAARIAGSARGNEVLASRTVVDLVTGSGIEFVDRGEHVLKGIPGSWALFSAAADS